MQLKNSVWPLQWRQYYFPEKLKMQFNENYESENFTDSSLHHIFESKNFRFPFFYEKEPNLGSEM